MKRMKSSGDVSAAEDERARRLHAEAIIILCHDHIPPWIDLQGLQAGGITAKFSLLGLDVRLDAPDRETFLASINQQEGWCKQTLLIFDRARCAIESNSQDMLLVDEPNDVLRAKREGKVGILLGSEGGKLIEGSLELLRTFYRLGLRQMQLTWAHGNQLSTGEVVLEHGASTDGYFFSDHLKSGSPNQAAQGLTEIGRQVIAEMNRLGIIVDLCHLSRPAMREALAISTKPVLAGHTTAKVLGHRLPSLTDQEIRAIADKGGVIGLHFMTHMLTGRLEPPATMDEVLAQIEYIVNVGGMDVMALGPDYFYDPDGRFQRNSGQTISFPTGLEDASQMLNLTRALVRQGYADSDILKILGGNLLRLMQDVKA
jgi:membrane dipeptidase